ncbi:MAG: GNAT family N-acetyltransferase [Lachnospiraceae bacterium]|nr:GNAT family N-acetyltransferase [Lachnospiraceae bacterium]
MTNKDLLRIAMAQSAADIGCRPDDFLADNNVVVPFQLNADAKKYYKLPIACNLVSYGNNIVAAAADDVSDIVKEYIGKFEFYHCFETPNMHWLNERLASKGYAVCFMAEYYLPNLSRLSEQPCSYTLRTLEKDQFEGLYLPKWSNALCRDRKELDVLGVGAYDGNKLIGLAGCSADAKEMWQIGVDVLPEYRRRGIASAITSKLAIEILSRNKVPFYCSAWSNIRSVRNGIKSGFIPAWVEMTVKPVDVVNELNL